MTDGSLQFRQINFNEKVDTMSLNDNKAEDDLPRLQWQWEEDQDDIEIAAAEKEQRKQQHRNRIRTKHPFLNDNHIELLGSIEDAIEEHIPQVHLPKLQIQNIQHALTIHDVRRLLQWPTLTFVVTFSFSGITILLNNVTLGRLYPYLVTLVTFVASVPTIVHKYDGYFDKIQTGIEATKQRIDPAFNKLEQRTKNLISNVHGQINQFVSRSKSKLQVTQVQRHSTVLLTQVEDLGGLLDRDCDRRLQQSLDNVRNQMTVDHFIPWALKRKRNFRIVVVVPILIVMLSIQFLGTWRVGDYYLDPTTTTTTTTTTVEGDGDGEDNGISQKWEPILSCSQTYVMAVLQVGFAYMVTRSQRVVGYVNRKIRRINHNINRYLHQKAGEVFESIFFDTMKRAQTYIWDIVTQLHFIEQAITKTQMTAHHQVGKASQYAATQTAMKFEKVTGLTPVGSPTWFQSITTCIEDVIYKMDDVTVGFINCTGVLPTTN